MLKILLTGNCLKNTKTKQSELKAVEKPFPSTICTSSTAIVLVTLLVLSP
jgi:hypothetical protein